MSCQFLFYENDQTFIVVFTLKVESADPFSIKHLQLVP